MGRAGKLRRQKLDGAGIGRDLPALRPLVPLALSILLAVTPLGLLNHVFVSHDVMPKLILILCGAALLLLFAPRWVGDIPRLWHSTTGRIWLVLVAAAFASLTLSTVASDIPGLSFFGGTWRRFGFVEQSAILTIALAVATWTARDPKWLTTLCRLLSVSGAILAIYACLQYFGFDPFLDPSLYKLEIYASVVRPPATMGQSIYFAAWMAPVALLSGACSAAETAPGWRPAHVTSALLGLIATLLSGSRGALLAAIAGFAFFALRADLGPAFRKRLAIAAAALVVTASAFALSPLGGQIRHRMQQWIEDPGGPRLQMWRETAGLVAQHPILGTGPETFGEEFRAAQSDSLSRAYPDFFNETPHNVFLDTASAQGLVGMLVIAAVFALGAAGGKGLSPLQAGFGAAVVAILVASLFASFSLMEALCLWCFSGIVAAIKSEESGVQAATRQASSGWFRLLAIPAAGFVATAVVLAVPDAGYVNLKDAAERGDRARAEDIYLSASRWSGSLLVPGNELYASRELATIARSLGDTPDAGRMWRLAASASSLAERSGEERGAAALQSALLAASLNDAATAESELRKAIAFAPNWYRPHLFLAQLMQALDRTTEANAEEQRGKSLAGNRLRQ